MAAITGSIVLGLVAVANLSVSSDLFDRYSSTAFPSNEIRTAVIFALATSAWGILLAVILYLYNAESATYGTALAPGTFLLMLTFLLDLVSAALLTKATVHGGACLQKAIYTCKLYNASLAFEWIMVGLAFLSMLYMAILDQQRLSLVAAKYIA
ncbi:hypothetical protein P389DRAFT_48466 [Cystobasidium minutum MCA 4210]|uniref:uncharacterized protein n=1 Tax=Cystobasidium minutum MCA 4210 TaxID=1397322 RepID=UPI0034CE70FC|eukprot:jgi/Rhomi1/48466/CE48465_322